MPMVRIGRCLKIANWAGRRPRGLSGFEPRNADKYAFLNVLNVPLFELIAMALLTHGPERGYQYAGIFWRLFSKAANTPIRGHLVDYDVDGRIVPLRDEQIARELGVGLHAWAEARDALLPGSGAGLLASVEVDHDVEPAEERRYRQDPQLPLPGWGTAQSGSSTSDQSRSSTFGGAPESGIPVSRDREKWMPPETKRNEAKEVKEVNETKRTEAKEVGRPLCDRVPSDQARAFCPQEVENEEAGEAEGWYKNCRSLCLSEPPQRRQACDAFIAMLTALLGTAGPRDRKQWSTIFAAMWSRPCMQSAEAATPLERAARVDLAYRRACEVTLDPETINPKARFAEWAIMKHYLRRRREGAAHAQG